MYRLYAAISIIIGMYLDSVLFAKVNIAGVVPDCVLVVIVCMGIQLGATEAAAAGCRYTFRQGGGHKRHSLYGCRLRGRHIL